MLQAPKISTCQGGHHGQTKTWARHRDDGCPFRMARQGKAAVLAFHVLREANVSGRQWREPPSMLEFEIHQTVSSACRACLLRQGRFLSQAPPSRGAVERAALIAQRSGHAYVSRRRGRCVRAMCGCVVHFALSVLGRDVRQRRQATDCGAREAARRRPLEVRRAGRAHSARPCCCDCDCDCRCVCFCKNNAMARSGLDTARGRTGRRAGDPVFGGGVGLFRALACAMGARPHHRTSGQTKMQFGSETAGRLGSHRAASCISGESCAHTTGQRARDVLCSHLARVRSVLSTGSQQQEQHTRATC